MHQISNTQRTENKTTNVVIQQHSCKLLMMDVLMSETCWVHKKWNKIASDNKLVFYSSTFKLNMNMLISKYMNHLLTVCLDFGFAEFLSSILFVKEGWMGRHLWEFCRNFLYDVPFVRKTWRRNARLRIQCAFSLLLIQWQYEPFSRSSILFTLLHPNLARKPDCSTRKL